jgi:hypothetical protein
MLPYTPAETRPRLGSATARLTLNLTGNRKSFSSDPSTAHPISLVVYIEDLNK